MAEKSSDRMGDPENEMQVFQLLGITALFLVGPAAFAAETVVTPGQLADPASSARSPFSSTVAPASVLPKRNPVIIEDRREKRIQTLWIASILAMTAATTADAVSSWHKQESNGVLASSNGTFGGKGVALKAGIAVGFLTPQIIFRKHHDWHIAFAVGNLAEAGVFTGAAIHNYRLK